jgi:hypothetical protein
LPAFTGAFGLTPLLPYSGEKCTTIHPQDLRTLRSFGDDYPEAERFLVYRGKERLKRDGVIIQPAEEFLLSLR